MDVAHTYCPDCGAALPEHITCSDHFYQMLYWETEYPDLGAVHHLMVLSYHLQHPSLYSPDGLHMAIRLLQDFEVHEMTPQEVRRRHMEALAAQKKSGEAKTKITATADAQGQYAHPVAWTIRAADVVAQGAENYIDSVRAWSHSILEELKQSGNMGG